MPATSPNAAPLPLDPKIFEACVQSFLAQAVYHTRQMPPDSPKALERQFGRAARIMTPGAKRDTIMDALGFINGLSQDILQQPDPIEGINAFCRQIMEDSRSKGIDSPEETAILANDFEVQYISRRYTDADFNAHIEHATKFIASLIRLQTSSASLRTFIDEFNPSEELLAVMKELGKHTQAVLLEELRDLFELPDPAAAPGGRHVARN